MLTYIIHAFTSHVIVDIRLFTACLAFTALS